MQVIRQPGDKVSKLWAKPKLAAGEYRLTRYVLREPTPQGELLYHTLTGEMVLLSPQEKDTLNALPAPYSDPLLPFIQDHFVVPASFDEAKVMRQLRAVVQNLDESSWITGYTILPTTHCNARCFYCYESDLEHVHMTEETADRVIRFICEHHGDQPVTLGWFGGEPLVGWKRIDQISRGLKDAGIDFKSNMITNGYLFDEEKVRKAKELWQLRSMQITLDGTEQVYNRVKLYAGVSGSPFERVLSNIGALLDAEIAVSIRMNMDKHNHDDLAQLIDLLAERFGGRKGFSANVAVLFENAGFAPIPRCDSDAENLRRWRQGLNKRLQDLHLGYPHNDLPMLRHRFCMADNDASVIIMPDGTFRKCEHDVGGESFGSLEDGWTNQEKREALKKEITLSVCSDCSLEPYCYHITACT